MGARVLVRAASLIGFALCAWSNNVRWGSDATLRGGPPIQWARIAVGATILSALATVAIWLGTRPAAGSSRLWLRAAACLLALGVAAIAIYLRREAYRLGLTDLLGGAGWSWLTAGAGVTAAAAAGSFALGGAAPRGASTQRTRRKRHPRGA